MTTKDEFLASPEASELKRAWELAVQETPLPPNSGLAPAGGVNLKMNLPEALQASWQTYEAAEKFSDAAHHPTNFLAWLTFSVAAINAARSILSAMVEKMDPLAYVVYVHLAKHHPDWVEKTTLEAEIDKFLDGPRSADFAWYLGMSEERARLAKEQKAELQDGWLDAVINQLEHDTGGKKALCKGSTVQYVPCNFKMSVDCD
jgi:hypothetical protein